MVETEAPAKRRKLPETATPSTYSHRARRRLYPTPHLHPGANRLESLERGALRDPLRPLLYELTL